MDALRDVVLVCVVLLLAGVAQAQTEELTKEQADKIALDSVALYRSGDSAGALAALDRALAFYRRTGDRESEGDVLYARGMILSSKDTTKALEAFKESLAIARELASDDEADVLRAMAMTMIDARQYAEAGQAFEEERAIHVRTKNRKAEGEALFNLGFVAAAQGRDAEALPLLEQALAIRREVGDREGEARTLESAALVYNRVDQKQTALDALEKALPIWRELGETESADKTQSYIAQLRATLKPSKPITARQRAQSDQAHELNNECTGRLMAGDPAGALTRCERARDLFRKAGDRGGEAMAVVNLGMAYYFVGEHARSREISLQGLALARETGNEETQANAFNNLALVDLGRAQFPQALTYLQRALAIWRKVHDLPAEQRTLGNIAGAQAVMGQLTEAAETFEKLLPRQFGTQRAQILVNLGQIRARQKNFTAARALMEEAAKIQLQTGDPIIRTTLGNLGTLHAELGEYEEALELIEQSMAISRKIGDKASLCGDLARIAEIKARQNEPARALELYQQALADTREIGSPPNESAYLAGIGRIHESQGKLQLALDNYLQAMAIEETIRAGGQTEEIKTALAERATDIYERTARLLVRLDRPTEAFDFAERARSRTFLDQLGNTGIETRAGGSEKEIEQERLARLAVAGTNRLLQQEKAKARAEQNAERIQTLSNQLAAKRREYADVMTRLKLSNAEYASLVAVAPLKLAEVQQLLQPDTTLLSYFVTADATTAFIVTRDTFKAVELPVSEKDLRAAVEELRAFSGIGGPPSPALARLSAALIEPVLPSIRTPLVGIVPHGVLHLLPFAALRGKEPGSWLGQDYTLFHLPSASTLPFIQQKRKAARGELFSLAQGQPAGLPALRHAEKEAEAVAALFGVKALTGRAATETALRERATDAGILHLAAHGQLNAVVPLFSRLVLAPEDDLDTARDGLLEVREIYGLDLKKASLVVLSACQTQLGAQSKGDDVVGLSRAFIYAGSPTVLASLWSVDDAATAVLMMSFYHRLREGAGAAAALRAAQAETREKHPDPYYWASFVLTGDPR